ncbi:YjeF-like protein [Pseudomonas tremae]|uniref:Multifunctional fusion protein n=4 Tax=Pseudomonas syringae group TaxID=136849 RepID=A0AA40TVN8_9PSED|nr:YjeF-like protein [Pseudomonas coronafaciens pv. oryzae]KPZ02998.1 YjeF-like protein [Pseudomonas tremae]RMS99530.1 YjeF-like protein [Pseudomonas coronafaciens pv. oryzae]
MGVGTFAAMGCHIVHFAVITLIEPALQVLLVLCQVEAADPDFLKAQLTPPRLDRQGECGKIIGSRKYSSNSGHAQRETGAKVRIILPDIGAYRRMFDTKPHLPDALYSAAQVRDLDARLIAAGTPGMELMQRAAHATWRALRRRWPQANQLTVLAGRGNNAGDGYLVAALAHKAGWQVSVLAVGDPAALTGDAAAAYAAASAVGIQAWAGQPLDGVVLDALLGTGLNGEVREPYLSAIKAINASGLPVAAVDIPSGLSADSGQALGVAVRADLTVTFIGLKTGLLTGEAADLVGELVFDDLQADPELVAQTPVSAKRLDTHNLPLLAPRPRTAHKGMFGRVLVIGGDHGFGGAALLSAESALRSGAGMLTLATRAEHIPAALTRMPEIMSAAISSANQLMALIEPASVLVVGPGLGQDAWGRSLLSAAANAERPQVWDADALNRLATGQVSLPANSVITPHPGEAARLLGVAIKDIQADRLGAVRALARKFNTVCVLKGSGSLIADAGGQVALCDRGHPAMATAGLGDVLAGLIGALMAQHLTPFDAACLAVWLHASAGQKLGETGRGLAASDIIPAIRQLLEELQPCLI